MRNTWRYLSKGVKWSDLRLKRYKIVYIWPTVDSKETHRKVGTSGGRLLQYSDAMWWFEVGIVSQWGWESQVEPKGIGKGGLTGPMCGLISSMGKDRSWLPRFLPQELGERATIYCDKEIGNWRKLEDGCREARNIFLVLKWGGLSLKLNC